MATTETISFGDGTTTQFSFTFPYIKTEDVRVELQEFDTVESTVISRVQISSFSIPSNNPTVVDFSAIGAATNYQAITGAPLTNHAVNTSNIIRVRIYRFTSADANPSTFLQGSAIRAQDLNDNFEQILYIMQERQNTIQAIQLGGIGENIIGTVSIKDDAITADKLRDSTVTDSDRAVTTNHIRDNAITTAKIANDAVTTAKIANDAVTTAKIANDAVTTAKLASDLTVDLASGTAGSPSLTFDANTGLYSPGADQVAISTGGTGRLFINSAGSVGIGSSSPQSELTVRGSNPQITLEPTADTQNCRIEFALTDGTVQSRITGGGSQGSEIRFSQGPAERFRITADGKLLVGTPSASGSAILQVAGGISATGAAIISGLTYPTSDGEADQVLKTNGSGTLSFGSALPAGTVIYYAASTAPTGYLKANGDVIPNGSGTVQGVTADFSALYAVIGSTYGSAGQLPDLRGEFIRGYHDGDSADPDYATRNFGSFQNDAFESHYHNYYNTASDDIAGGGGNRTYITVAGTGSATQPTGGNETRPRNVALLACIKY